MNNKSELENFMEKRDLKHRKLIIYTWAAAKRGLEIKKVYKRSKNEGIGERTTYDTLMACYKEDYVQLGKDFVYNLNKKARINEGSKFSEFTELLREDKKTNELVENLVE